MLSQSDDNNSPPDHGDKLYAAAASQGIKAIVGVVGDTQEITDESGWVRPKAKLLQMFVEAQNTATTFIDQTTRQAWQRSLKSWRNEHFDGSKYRSDQWAHRSKIFRPKTRVAIRKGMANAASALFSTSDVVKLRAQNEADPIQRASAAVKQELLNYRLDRTSGRAGIPWFLTTMGANQDARIHGICVSMQSWKFEERVVKEMVEHPDPVTGAMTSVETERREIVIDRPDVELYAPENALIDPLASWLRPAQSASFVLLRKPMLADDVFKMVKGGNGTSAHPGAVPWLFNTLEQIQSLTAVSQSQGPSSASSVRQVREGGNDPLSHGRASNRAMWVYTCFMRIDGEDYVFWTIDGRELLSAPALTRDVFPWKGGERPVVWGYGAIDAHRILPMSATEALQPLQQEANDIVNLRLDQLKQVANPLTKVIRGRNVDTQALQKRGPNSQVFLQSHDDIMFDRPPDVPSSAYAESNYINADFDDLAGNFSGGSVQTARNLNETVGGMKLLAGNAASLGEFDTSIWVQTWVEPVLGDLVKLEEYYESDATLLAIAGDKAKLVQKFGIDEITDDMLRADVTLHLNIGINGTDPMQRLQKLQTAGTMAMTFLAAEFQTGRIKVDARNIVDEIFGGAGYSDGGDRFFIFADEQQAQGQPGQPGQGQAQQEPDPMQIKMAEIEAEKQVGMAKVNAEADIKRLAVMAEIQRKNQLAQASIEIDAARETSRHQTATTAGYLKAMRERPQLPRHATHNGR